MELSSLSVDGGDRRPWELTRRWPYPTPKETIEAPTSEVELRGRGLEVRRENLKLPRMEAIGSWREFFGAAAGASAALAGLIFVALSVNVGHILKRKHLPPRAAAAVGFLILVLTVSLSALAPLPQRWFGGEVLVLTLPALGLLIWSGIEETQASRAEGRSFAEGLMGASGRLVQLAIIAIGGGLFLLGQSSGAMWLAGGAILIIVLAVAEAWVLLVEILR